MCITFIQPGMKGLTQVAHTGLLVILTATATITMTTTTTATNATKKEHRHPHQQPLVCCTRSAVQPPYQHPLRESGGHELVLRQCQCDRLRRSPLPSPPSSPRRRRRRRRCSLTRRRCRCRGGSWRGTVHVRTQKTRTTPQRGMVRDKRKGGCTYGSCGENHLGATKHRPRNAK